jgi:AcrR family transcriptional regulator
LRGWKEPSRFNDSADEFFATRAARPRRRHELFVLDACAARAERDRLTDAAEQLFLRKGFHAATMDEEF